jgi:hypothetical protein
MTRRIAGILMVLSIAACRGPSYNTHGGGSGGGDGGTGGTIPFTPDPPSTYVPKIKNILTGLAATATEVQTVTNDPSALGTLIDQWMATPQYQQKMQVFFQLMFQQMQVGVSDFKQVVQPNDFVGTLQPLVIQNAIESFARTANYLLMTQNQPLTSMFTTNQFMMTTALLQWYGLMDWHQSDDNDDLDDKFSDAYGPKSSKPVSIVVETTTPIPNDANGIPETYDPTSPYFMQFYDPSGTASSSAISSLQGAIQVTNTLYGAGLTAAATPINGAGATNDFNDWRLVTITQSTGPSSNPAFYNLPALRKTSSIAMQIPRIGYFTTPAFAANWPTNSGNMMRAVLNQALIVATGHQIDGTDGTIPTPMPPPGMNLDNNLQGGHDTGVCKGCHQLLDPMRDILLMNYTWFFAPQTDPNMINSGAWFAFFGTQSAMSTLQEFAQLLVKHPMVQAAWVQKLCYYVNSAPCDASDPAFTSIVTDFGNNNMSWSALVKEFMLSPITTNVSVTQTYETNGEVIAVSRRDHLCAAINNRLGFVDICQLSLPDQIGSDAVGAIPAIVSGMPADAYGRGAVNELLPTSPTLFYRSALENVCSYLAQATIDATAIPTQPNVMQWKSSDPLATNVAAFVGLVMAITPNDPRYTPLVNALTDHYNSALGQGAVGGVTAATNALRSTFVVACLSPSFAGVGM